LKTISDSYQFTIRITIVDLAKRSHTATRAAAGSGKTDDWNIEHHVAKRCLFAALSKRLAFRQYGALACVAAPEFGLKVEGDAESSFRRNLQW